MNQLEQVLVAAKNLALQNKTPTVSMLKSRLNSVPLPILIQGLQKYKSMTVIEIDAIATTQPVPNSDHNEIATTLALDTQLKFQQLEKQYEELKKDYQNLDLRLKELEQRK